MSDIRKVTRIYQDGTYLKNNQAWHAEDSSWKAKHITTILHNNNVNPRNICEVGCGAGEILKQLSGIYKNTDFVGYELSPQAFKLCKERESERIKYYLENIFEQNAFYEVLLCIDVFEHVEDYMGFLKALKTKSTFKIFHIPLDVSVLAVLRLAMISARQRVGHLHYFTRETALATLEDCGYEIVDSFYTTSFFDFPPKTLKAKVARWPRKIVFDMSPDLGVRLLGGCSLLVLAK